MCDISKYKYNFKSFEILLTSSTGIADSNWVLFIKSYLIFCQISFWGSSADHAIIMVQLLHSVSIYLYLFPLGYILYYKKNPHSIHTNANGGKPPLFTNWFLVLKLKFSFVFSSYCLIVLLGNICQFIF